MKNLYVIFILTVLSDELVTRLVAGEDFPQFAGQQFMENFCSKSVSYMETYAEPYFETYREKTWGIFYRTRIRWNYRTETRLAWRKEYECCDGYKKVWALELGTGRLSRHQKCEPICPNCNNGSCLRPNICICDYGYRSQRTINSFVGCFPVCTHPCVNGKCASPDVCECDPGYKLNNDNYTCEPVCTVTCSAKAYCYKPDQCRCMEGYKSDVLTNTCEPICERECVHGKCTAPDTCTCDDGYEPDPYNFFVCKPTCENGCLYGMCTVPNVCICDEGYTFKTSGCEPVCSEACVMGTCVAPESCSCSEGYGLLENSKYVCEPVCEKACLNGRCTAPGVCRCNEGFRFSGDETEKHICKPYCKIPCEPYGVCTAPDVCACFEGYRQVDQAEAERTNVTVRSNCEPICDPECTNGFCHAPGECYCYAGYHIHYLNPDVMQCEPSCSQNCVNSFCSAPETCQCNEGYRPSNSWNVCEPVCKTDCINGYCTAPNECTCNPGYQPTEGNRTSLCEPVCNPSCRNGICTQPDVCSCNPGYRPSNKTNACDPICHPACETNGICKGPDLCVCKDGYRMVYYDGKDVPFGCEPICDVECGNGTCTAPDHCVCFDGYRNAKTGGCEPVCSTCGNGTCVAPEVCECDDGFVLADLGFEAQDSRASDVLENRTGNGSRCVPYCEKCDNGECLAPGVCQCYTGFVMEGTCVHACQGGCGTHGECVSERRTCKCDYGWTGLHCDQPTLCVLTLSNEENRTEQLTTIEKRNVTIDRVLINNPACSECVGKVNNETLCFKMYVNDTKDETKIGCLMNEECLPLSSYYKNRGAIITLTSVIIGGILLVTAITIYATLRKRRNRQVDLGDVHIIRSRHSTSTQGLIECQQKIPEYDPYIETFRTSDPFGFYNIRTRTNYRRLFHDQIRCCEGYVLSGAMCTPRCPESCKKGTCKEPDVCTCNEGYRMSNDGKCAPECTNGCVNGTCVDAEVCSCNKGYSLDSDGFTCRPVCDESCEWNNGSYCSQPNVCTCRLGYRKIDDDYQLICKPVCDHECTNGHCTLPNVCTCNPAANASVCEPICSEPCEMGTCVAPESCSCTEGYGLRYGSSKYKCEPICENDCSNGQCIKPGFCVCNKGYVLSNGTCKPHCPIPCEENAECIGDGRCTCMKGYHLILPHLMTDNIYFSDILIKVPRVSPVCQPVCNFMCINGRCTELNVCTCNPGHYPSWIYHPSRSNSMMRFCLKVHGPPCDEHSCGDNGTCDVSGVCVCNEGYAKDTNNDCVPFCDPACSNGTCTAPNRCECHDGFASRNESFCEPVCEKGCQNGDCIGPDHCICHDGFVPDIVNHSGCIPECTRNCSGHGECVIGRDNLYNACECQFGWTGQDCDEPIMCLIMMAYDHYDVNRITIRNNTNSTILQAVPSVPYCDCDYSLDNETLCIMMHSVNGNTTDIGCLLNTDLPCRVVNGNQRYISTNVNKIVWPFVTIAILLATGLGAIAYINYIKSRKRQQKKLDIGPSTSTFARESFATESLLPDNEIQL
ncbi:PREDICTED: fibrillin-1-like [Wasmannia auropunctata]|uniref:fibrillin-1-like n=1 Tax=Wasmannia auropunctata TaxID=64793 RepID=UPI0005EF87FD|nr:PREDICTED: fibrillin-1-like [Wasmannia auropunctata]